MKEFTNGKFTIVFYKKDNDKKFSFLIKDEPELTAKLLASVKTKKVRQKNLHYAVKGIFDKLDDLILTPKNPKKMEKQNPIVQLAETVQKLYGANIQTAIMDQRGPDHNPIIEVRITLPNGNEYYADGANQRIAKQLAAEFALEGEGLK